MAEIALRTNDDVTIYVYLSSLITMMMLQYYSEEYIEKTS
jgi:hypothetical protein